MTIYNYQETLREYAALASSDLTETLRMEFSELKAEAYCSLGEGIVHLISPKVWAPVATYLWGSVSDRLIKLVFSRS